MGNNMHVGQSAIRTDGHDKVTGRALYVDDVRPDHCLYAATVRSPVAKGRFLGLEFDPAFDWSQVTVCTADDIPGENVVALMTDDQPVLVVEHIRHVEEPVALVAAPTRDMALAAVEHMTVRCEEEAPLFDASKSRDNQAQLIFGEDNVFSHIVMERTAGAFEAQGGVLVTGTYRVGHQEQLYIETQGMTAIPKPDGSLTLFGSMQCPYYIVKALKRVIGHDRLNVVQAVTGGGFGGKEEYPSMMAAHASILAIKTGRPIKLIYRRDEDLRATTKRHPAVMNYETMVDEKTGKLLAARVNLLFDGGAYNTLSPVVNSRGVIHAMGPYMCPWTRIEGLMVATNTPPNGAFRGFGAPQVMFAAERHMDRIARTLKLSPTDVRRVNIYQDGHVTPTGQALTGVSATEVLERALEAADAGEPRSPLARPGGGGDAARLAHGRGLALAWHGCGFTGNGEAALEGKVDIALEGQAVVIYSGSTDIGQGTDTIFPSIAATVLGIDTARVSNAAHDTAIVPDSGPTVASRTAMVVGGVVKQAAENLLETLRIEVGDTSGTLSFDECLARRESDKHIKVRAQYIDAGLEWNPQTYQGDAYPTYGWSCVIVDVDVDMDTGEVLYARLIQATDVGKALNPVLCSGQLEGGVLQALGYATSEQVVLDEQGGMANNRLTNYIIPTALDAPPMETILVENPYEGGPFGAKGIGEIPHDVPAPAVAQALEQAAGIVLETLPMMPENIIAALESQ